MLCPHGWRRCSIGDGNSGIGKCMYACAVYCVRDFRSTPEVRCSAHAWYKQASLTIALWRRYLYDARSARISGLPDASWRDRAQMRGGEGREGGQYWSVNEPVVRWPFHQPFIRCLRPMIWWEVLAAAWKRNSVCYCFVETQKCKKLSACREIARRCLLFWNRYARIITKRRLLCTLCPKNTKTFLFFK